MEFPEDNCQIYIDAKLEGLSFSYFQIEKKDGVNNEILTSEILFSYKKPSENQGK